MRITQESDYALRILTALAERDEVVDANSLAEETSVTLRFTLKILNKLTKNGFVSSFKGAKGGYKLNTDLARRIQHSFQRQEVVCHRTEW